MSDREIMNAKTADWTRKLVTFRDPVVERVVDKFVQRSDLGFEKKDNNWVLNLSNYSKLDTHIK